MGSLGLTCDQVKINFPVGGSFITASKQCHRCSRLENIALTVSISLDQQPWNHGKSYFWPKFFLQPPETKKQKVAWADAYPSNFFYFIVPN
jgi:hypothetical protein